MSIEQTLNDRPLLEVVAMLSSRDESGRLKITDGSTRGAFFFRKGKLVDARMGPFTGFQAVNLAVSIGHAARLSFDSSIQPPNSSFKVLNERIILKERFGIETTGPEAACDPGITETAERASIPSQQATPAEATFPERSVSAEPRRNDPAPTGIADDFSTRVLSRPAAIPLLAQPVTPSGVGPASSRKERAFLATSLLDVTNPSLTSSTRQRVAIRASVILLVVITATVGVASYWSKGKESAPQDFSSPKTAGALPAPIVVPSTAQGDEQNTRPKSTTSRDAQPSTARTDAPLKVKADSDVPRRHNAEAASKATTKAPEKESSTKPSSRTITVVVQIDDGHVTEAYIQNPKGGLAAYEAAALRLARQRRYPKATKRKETITLQVTREP